MLSGVWLSHLRRGALVRSPWTHITASLSSREWSCLQAPHPPMWTYSQGSSGSEYNGPSPFYSCSSSGPQSGPKDSTVYQSKATKYSMRITEKNICFLNIDPELEHKKYGMAYKRSPRCFFDFVVSEPSSDDLMYYQLFSLYCFLVVLAPVNPKLVLADW